MPQEHVPIPAEIRGRYRHWRAEIQRQADCIQSVFYGPLTATAAGNFVACTTSGRERAFNQLRHLLENAGARFIDRQEPRRARWAFLRPVDEWIHPTLLTISRYDMGGHTWCAAFSDHSLLRALQRSPPGIDLSQVCWDGIETARGLSLKFIMARPRDEAGKFTRFRVGAGAGSFVSVLSRAEGPGGDFMPLIQCPTWLASDQLSRLQELEIVPEGEAGDRFDELYGRFRGKWRQTPTIRQRARRRA